MIRFAPTLLFFVVATGPATASSILVLGEQGEFASPSIDIIRTEVTNAAAGLPERRDAVSESVLDIGEPAVTGELTSAVPEQPDRHSVPTVIRGVGPSAAPHRMEPAPSASPSQEQANAPSASDPAPPAERPE